MGNQVVVDYDLVKVMERLLTGQTDESLNDRFGISYNTWRKLKAGQPVRKSLAARLQSRLSQMNIS
jgi:hypothetical protein